jgi:DNA-binding NtrC family response regulator
MSHPLQAKLLRVLQDGVVRRVGSEQQDAVVDVRFVSATNRDPQDAVVRGILREDLFYRLCVVPIHLPPLRERLEDIPLLTNHFLAHYWQRHRRPGAPMPHFNDAAIAALRSWQWRGNVRELQNVVEHTAVLADPGQELGPSEIPLHEESVPSNGGNSRLPPSLFEEGFHVARERLVSQFEKEYLSRLVERALGNMSKAARLANIDRTTLYRLMEKHSFRRDELSEGAG